jgi:four helix bundle protein
MSVHLLDEAWKDIKVLQRHRFLDPVSMQLYRAVGSIGVNLGEGYSRSSGMDRVRFFEYALGSARESQLWYYASRHVMDSSVLIARYELLTRIAKILSTAIPQERNRSIRPKRT